MATAKEIAEIIGTPYRTIETWSRTRDDRFLLSKFLKSFSAFDMQERIDKILLQEGLIKKSWKEFVGDVADDPMKAGITQSNKIKLVESAHLSEKPLKLDLSFVTNDGILYIIEFSSLLPSKPNLLKTIDRLESYAMERYSSKETINGLKIVMITKSKIPLFIENDQELSNKVTVLNFDNVAEKLYGTQIVTI